MCRQERSVNGDRGVPLTLFRQHPGEAQLGAHLLRSPQRGCLLIGSGRFRVFAHPLVDYAEIGQRQVREGRIVLIGYECDQGIARVCQVIVAEVGDSEVETRELTEPATGLGLCQLGKLLFGAFVLLGVERAQRGVKMVAGDAIAPTLIHIHA